jgi:hypothetical protein
MQHKRDFKLYLVGSTQLWKSLNVVPCRQVDILNFHKLPKFGKVHKASRFLNNKWILNVKGNKPCTFNLYIYNNDVFLIIDMTSIFVLLRIVNRNVEYNFLTHDDGWSSYNLNKLSFNSCYLNLLEINFAPHKI